MGKRWVSAKDLAAYLGYRGVSTIYRLGAQGLLPAPVRFSKGATRYDLDEVDRMVEARAAQHGAESRPGWWMFIDDLFERVKAEWPHEALGLYAQLAERQFRNGELPLDEAALRPVDATDAVWQRAWPFVDRTFPIVGAARMNADVDRKRTERRARCRKQRRDYLARQKLAQQDAPRRRHERRTGARS